MNTFQSIMVICLSACIIYLNFKCINYYKEVEQLKQENLKLSIHYDELKEEYLKLLKVNNWRIENE